MRVKILIFPAALAITVAVAIAYVWPEKEAMSSAGKALNESKSTLQNIETKKNNINGLKKSLEQNQEKKAVVLNYLPSEQKEEEIINKLNWLAADSGVVLATLSPEKETAKTAAGNEGTTGFSSKDILFASSSQNPEAVDGQPKATVRLIKTELGFSGNYAAVKTFFDQIYKMEMFNSVVSFSVFKQEESGNRLAEGEKAPNPELLFAKAEIAFGYLPPVRLEKNYAAPIFSRSSFDFTPCEKLNQMTVKKAPALEVGEHGRTNPFLP